MHHALHVGKQKIGDAEKWGSRKIGEAEKCKLSKYVI